MFFQEWKDWLILILWVWLFGPNAIRFFHDVVKESGWYGKLANKTVNRYESNNPVANLLALLIIVSIVVPILVLTLLFGPFVWIYFHGKDRKNASPEEEVGHQW